MRVLGITAEYNPFHNGHKYHLEQSRALTGADCVVAVMSGNFTQRGEPAVLDKWTRSRMAVENGVDLVIELPVLFACNRAEYFAKGAVDILCGIGATHISFGSESGDLKALEVLVEALQLRDEEIHAKRTALMKDGFSFAKANEMAVRHILGGTQADLLLEPNNILALEYLKRIRYWKTRGREVQAVTVKRCGSGYFDADAEAGFAGASYIRNMLDGRAVEDAAPETIKESLCRFMPRDAAMTLLAYVCEEEGLKRTSVKARYFDLIRAETLKADAAELAGVYCIGEGLENRFKREIMNANSLDALISSMVSRRYTEAAIRRMLVYILLGIREKEPQGALYARVLAAGEKGRELLKSIKTKERGCIPVLTNINKEETEKSIARALHYDTLASDMYNLLHGRDLYAFSDKVITPYME